MTEAEGAEIFHASCVSFGGFGVLITGKSGSGKSTLALSLMAHGAGLVADDRVVVEGLDDAVIATCPAPLVGVIEARGVGVLAAEAIARTPIRLVVDLDRPEPDRLPPARRITVCSREIHLIYGAGNGSLAAIICQYAKGGRTA